MDVTPTTSGTAAASATTSKTKTDATANAVSGDFDTFLKLLTTQMRNQDPLKPMDSTEFVAQLAAFSGVEQQVRANDRLDDILGVLSGGSPAGLADWIGRDVRVAAKVEFEGTPVDVAVNPEAGADSAVLVVKNDFDQVVARVPVAADADTVSWDGKGDTGGTAANGLYSFTLESYLGDALLGSQQGKVFSTVREVRIADGTPVLVLGDGSQVPLDEIAGVR